MALFTVQGIRQLPAAQDPSTILWVNAVIADGGAVSANQQGYVDTLIKSLKSYGLFSLLDRLWLYGGESDSHQAKIDIISLSSGTNHGATLGAGGYTGDGSSTYVDTGFQSGTNYTVSNASYGVYQRTTDTGNISEFVIGGSNSHQTRFEPNLLSTGQGRYAINNDFASATPSISDTRGFWIVNLNGSSNSGLYRNGSSVDAQTPGSQLLNDQNFLILASGGSSPGGFAPDQIACSFMGAGFTTTQISNFYTAIQVYMSSWGINV